VGADGEDIGAGKGATEEDGSHLVMCSFPFAVETATIAIFWKQVRSSLRVTSFLAHGVLLSSVASSSSFLSHSSFPSTHGLAVLFCCFSLNISTLVSTRGLTVFASFSGAAITVDVYLVIT